MSALNIGSPAEFEPPNLDALTPLELDYFVRVTMNLQRYARLRIKLDAMLKAGQQDDTAGIYRELRRVKKCLPSWAQW